MPSLFLKIGFRFKQGVSNTLLTDYVSVERGRTTLHLMGKNPPITIKCRTSGHFNLMFCLQEASILWLSLLGIDSGHWQTICQFFLCDVVFKVKVFDTFFPEKGRMYTNISAIFTYDQKLKCRNNPILYIFKNKNKNILHKNVSEIYIGLFQRFLWLKSDWDYENQLTQQNMRDFLFGFFFFFHNVRSDRFDKQ